MTDTIGLQPEMTPNRESLSPNYSPQPRTINDIDLEWHFIDHHRIVIVGYNTPNT